MDKPDRKPNLYDTSSHHQLMASYGLFMVIWSVFENVLEICIMREAKLEMAPAIILTSGLGFERKAGIARSLLALKLGSERAVSLITEITQEASRNSHVHGKVFVGNDSISFLKIETSRSLKFKERSYRKSDFVELVNKISKLVGELQKELNVGDQVLLEHGDILKGYIRAQNSGAS